MNDTARVEALIPHRLPMRLLERFDDPVERGLEAFAEVRPSWPTVRDGTARTVMLVELLAQAAGVLQRFGAPADAEPPGGGLLVGIPTLTMREPRIPVGTALVCNVHILRGAQSYLVFEGDVTDSAGTWWLSATLQTYSPDSLDIVGANP